VTISKGLKRLLLIGTLLLKKDFKLKCFVLETGLLTPGILEESQALQLNVVPEVIYECKHKHIYSTYV
jgi:hypothetical protein